MDHARRLQILASYWLIISSLASCNEGNVTSPGPGAAIEFRHRSADARENRIAAGQKRDYPGSRVAAEAAVCVSASSPAASYRFRVEASGLQHGDNLADEVSVLPGECAVVYSRTDRLPEGGPVTLITISQAESRGVVENVVASDDANGTRSSFDPITLPINSNHGGFATYSFAGTAPSLDVSCSPNSVVLPTTSTTTLTCTVASRGGFSGQVRLQGTSTPAGITVVSFDEVYSLGSDGIAQIPVALTLTEGSVGAYYSATIVAVSGSVSGESTLSIRATANVARVNVIYLVPSDRSINQAALRGMERAIRHLQIWFANELGTGETFTIPTPFVRVYRSTNPAAWYNTNPAGGDASLQFWLNVTNEGFARTGGSFSDPDDIWLFYVDAETGPGQIVGGTSGVAVLPGPDVRGVAGQDPLQGTCRWVGGLGHEFGHALGLGHPPSCEGGPGSCPTEALMWFGYIKYPSAVLTDADRTVLAGSPFFSGDVSASSNLFDCASALSLRGTAVRHHVPTNSVANRSRSECGYRVLLRLPRTFL